MSVASGGDLFDREAFLARAASEASRLELRVWDAAANAATAAAFKRATRDALRAPVLVERSIHLRRLAKAMLPRALRPSAKRLATRFDKTSRALATRLF